MNIDKSGIVMRVIHLLPYFKNNQPKDSFGFGVTTSHSSHTHLGYIYRPFGHELQAWHGSFTKLAGILLNGIHSFTESKFSNDLVLNLAYTFHWGDTSITTFGSESQCFIHKRVLFQFQAIKWANFSPPWFRSYPHRLPADLWWIRWVYFSRRLYWVYFSSGLKFIF